MLNILIIVAAGVFSGWAVAINLSKYRAGSPFRDLIYVCITIISALSICAASSAVMFKVNILELPSPNAGLGELLFNSWAVTSWASLLVVPIVLIISMSERRKNRVPDLH
ncbi:hypothetical protein [Yoonia sp. I 8.24]|uniref:hypothetical protein n=1 Tax=Yoonia sp. I 8.24 TaxID=1537229 RepID=UPI001EDD4AFA|nr:hypothetical protein [Yoonia sp. I 8.24]MCG3269250.1 hypothetical protein [Yoonia sp. I 8.24]